MKLGEKIRAERRRLGLTQNAIAGNFITRNMLSAIESGKVSPSLETLHYLSQTLELPMGYLLNDDADLFFYKKEEKIAEIRRAYKMKKYQRCISLIESLGGMDDEVRYLFVASTFYHGRKLVIEGNLRHAEEYFSLCLREIDHCIYPTQEFCTLIPLYMAVIRNIQSPLLELDAEAFKKKIFSSYDYDFFQYLHQNQDFIYQNEIFRLHIRAKALLKTRKYHEAITILQQLEDMKAPEQYNSCVILGIYTDLELCYKELLNFEKAYRYANKRISLLEGFRT